jgi:hypothetical protein
MASPFSVAKGLVLKTGSAGFGGLFFFLLINRSLGNIIFSRSFAALTQDAKHAEIHLTACETQSN